jgi:predicted regulator of Ras-like GTPase activity (Roadblock/LC7/MglB family)
VTAPVTHGLSRAARNLHWLLANLIEEVPGLLSVAVVSSDGLLLLSSDPASNTPSLAQTQDGGAQADSSTQAAADPSRASGPGRQPRGSQAAFAGSAADLATIVSGLGSLTLAAAKVMDVGRVKQTVVTMQDGNLCVMAISDGSLLGVHATPECDMSIVAYQMAFFVSRAGHVLTPELRSELRQSLQRPEPEQQPAPDLTQHQARDQARDHGVPGHRPHEHAARDHQPVAGGRSPDGPAGSPR